jgi:trk system potassium uptake protein TrkH
LIVVDTGTHFSVFGQIVILILIQIGGLGYMTATSFLLLLVGRRVSLRDHMTMQEAVGAVLGDRTPWRLVSSVVGMTALIEGVGALLLAQGFVPQFGWIQGSWWSLFHSVSAFNNAGFGLRLDNLVSFQSNAIVILTISGLIITGGIGYSVLYECYEWARRVWLDSRQSRENFSLNFRISVSITLLLLIGGTLFIFGTELGNPKTLEPLSLPSQILSAWFQSVTARTAGFNSIDQTVLEPSTLFLTIILMFIGASPGGTGGGVKTTTLGTLLACTRSALGGAESVVLFRRTLPEMLVHKVVGILIGSATLVAACTTLLVLIDGNRFPFLKLMFEATSAFGTVGLSAANTPDLSPLSQFVLIPTMYCGRVGILVLMAALLPSSTTNKLIKYPEETYLIG